MKILFIILSLAVLGGCSIAPTSLSCGTDEDASYVTLENLKDNSPQTIKTYAELCGFHLEYLENAT